MAQATGESRRKSEALVTSERIRVNGELITDLAYRVSDKDIVRLDGKELSLIPKVYYLLNKPSGYTTTRADRYAKKIIIDLVPNNPPIFPVGRLDRETRGLIILTNDGTLANKLTHPSFEKEKEYAVITNRNLTKKEINLLASGIKLEEGKTRPAKILRLDERKYSIIIHEGRKRQIRRMLEAIKVQIL
ncbi:MAG: pseudouridine synthase, partial [Bacteriovoracaceae bacterium]